MKKKLPAFTFRTLINNYGQLIKESLGWDETTIEKDYNKYKVIQPDASVRDYIWSLFNRIILNSGSSSTYHEMGRFVARYEGKSGNQYHRIALKQEFESLKEQSKHSMVKQGIYVVGDKRCSHSMKYDNDIVHDFHKFPNGIPVANEDCSLLSCTCCCGIVGLRDVNGSLIWLDKD